MVQIKACINDGDSGRLSNERVEDKKKENLDHGMIVMVNEKEG